MATVVGVILSLSSPFNFDLEMLMITFPMLVGLTFNLLRQFY